MEITDDLFARFWYKCFRVNPPVTEGLKQSFVVSSSFSSPVNFIFFIFGTLILNNKIYIAVNACKEMVLYAISSRSQEMLRVRHLCGKVPGERHRHDRSPALG